MLQKLIRETIKLPFIYSMPSANQSFTAKALLDKNKDSKSPPSVFFISISTNEWGPESF